MRAPRGSSMVWCGTRSLHAVSQAQPRAAPAGAQQAARGVVGWAPCREVGGGGPVGQRSGLRVRTAEWDGGGVAALAGQVWRALAGTARAPPQRLRVYVPR